MCARSLGRNPLGVGQLRDSRIGARNFEYFLKVTSEWVLKDGVKWQSFWVLYLGIAGN